MAPPQVDGLRIAPMYLSRGILFRPISEQNQSQNASNAIPQDGLAVRLRIGLYLPSYDCVPSSQPWSDAQKTCQSPLVRISCACAMSCLNISAIAENRQELSSGTSLFRDRSAKDVYGSKEDAYPVYEQHPRRHLHASRTVVLHDGCLCRRCKVAPWGGGRR